MQESANRKLHFFVPFNFGPYLFLSVLQNRKLHFFVPFNFGPYLFLSVLQVLTKV